MAIMQHFPGEYERLLISRSAYKCRNFVFDDVDAVVSPNIYTNRFVVCEDIHEYLDMFTINEVGVDYREWTFVANAVVR